jgi:hypothetical protein
MYYFRRHYSSLYYFEQGAHGMVGRAQYPSGKVLDYSCRPMYHKVFVVVHHRFCMLVARRMGVDAAKSIANVRRSVSALSLVSSPAGRTVVQHRHQPHLSTRSLRHDGRTAARPRAATRRVARREAKQAQTAKFQRLRRNKQVRHRRACGFLAHVASSSVGPKSGETMCDCHQHPTVA